LEQKGATIEFCNSAAEENIFDCNRTQIFHTNLIWQNFAYFMIFLLKKQKTDEIIESIL